MQPISADEKKWRAQDDARMLAEAEQIKQDQTRLDAARQAAKEMADEETERAKAMRKVAGRKTGGGQSPTRPRDDRHSVASKSSQGSGTNNRFNVFKKI